MRLAAVLAALLAFALPARAENMSERLARRLDKAVRDSSQRTESEFRELLASGLHPGSPLAAIRRSITWDSCREGVEFLASDALLGRDTGSDGHRAAAEWAAKRFESFGLKPVGDDGGWFQNWKWARRKTMNVVALLEGETDEVVVVGAHLDHVGHGDPGIFSGRIPNPLAGEDRIYNGADDNASGSDALVHIAQALAALGKKPRRGVLFILFSGEEKGLLGSSHYLANPIVPLEKTVAMLNFDMVGRNKDRECAVLGAQCSPELGRAVLRANRGIGMKLDVPTDSTPTIFMQSDQFTFYQKRIPCLFFTTGGHTEYHTALDHADRINVGKIEDIAELGALLALGIAEDRQRPTWLPISGLGPKLGVTPQPLAGAQLQALGLRENEGGVRLASLMDNFPAKNAGLQVGDIVIAFDGKPLPRENTLEAFRKAITKVKAGGSQEVTVIRNTKRLTVTVQYEK